jgi:hypothetical protein
LACPPVLLILCKGALFLFYEIKLKLKLKSIPVPHETVNSSILTQLFIKNPVAKLYVFQIKNFFAQIGILGSEFWIR